MPRAALRNTPTHFIQPVFRVSSRLRSCSSPDPPAARASFAFAPFARLIAGPRTPSSATGQMPNNDSSQMKECLTGPENKTDEQPTTQTTSSETRGGASPSGTSEATPTPECEKAERKRPEVRSASGGADGGRRTSVGEPMDTSDASASQTRPTFPISKLKKIQDFPTETILCREHTVLVDTNWLKRDAIIPYEGRHVWDDYHVKLPHMCQKSRGSPTRWDVIKQSLQRLTRTSPSIGDVESAIMSYNSSYRDKWTFEALQQYSQHVHHRDNNLHLVIPKMAQLAAELPHIIKQSIPLLRQNQNRAVTLSQQQISCLLANAFFCTFPHRNSTKPGSEYANYPTINFSSLFGGRSDPTQSRLRTEKMRAILHYFNTVTNRDSEPKADGLVTFERISLHPSKFPEWKNEKKPLRNLHVSDEGSIEQEGAGMLQVDFASKYIGGGVLGSGLVQEEILFLMSPELIVARLFTEKLGPNECLKITGPQMYSCTHGYSKSFTWSGPYQDNTRRDEWKRRYRQIVAIDALDFKNPKDQYTKDNIKRELNKAFVGFSGRTKTAIATGNWGCGAFKGNPELKALIQLMAAAVAERDMAYFTFREAGLAQRLQSMHDILTRDRVTVDKLYKLLMEYSAYVSREHQTPKDLYSFIREKISHKSSL